MADRMTIFQRLNRVLSNGDYNVSNISNVQAQIPTIEPKPDDIIFRTTDKGEYDAKLLQAKQQKMMAMQWRRANYDLANKSILGLNEVKLMYRDVDLMDTFPEFGAALDIVSEEATQVDNAGQMLVINSKSERIKSILQDLFVNRLSINIMLPMICRSMAKYGNTFMLLNLDSKNGIMGWKQLPVQEMERYENGMENPYQAGFNKISNNKDDKLDDSTKFVWVGQTDYTPYRNWQIAHFRLLYNSMLLPYGVSYMHSARRHFRLLSMMEDMMLIYRLERSVERRVFKINVGAIDEEDVPAYVNQIADNFKRTPIIDPMTGQVDLRKNILNVQEDYFIPVRDDGASTPIEILNGSTNEKAMDDIQYVQKKILAALRIPKAFINFEEASGEGNNLALQDVRFARTVNKIQQALIMELNKVAIIHLYLLGFTDELTNFTITMNNPSTQAENLMLDNITKKIQAAKEAVADPGGGIPLFSMTRAWKEIMHWSENDIKNNLEELRLEKALGAELANTQAVIQKTGLFDTVDNIYGMPQGAQQAGAAPAPAPAGGVPGGAPPAGGGLDMGGMGAPGAMPMGQAAAEGGAPPMESIHQSFDKILKSAREQKNLINENLEEKRKKYTAMLEKRRKEDEKRRLSEITSVPLYDKAFLINEEFDSISKQLDSIVNKD